MSGIDALDRERLVELVTREVMKSVMEGRATADSAAFGDGPGSESSGSRPSSGSASSLPPICNPLVIVSGNPMGLTTAPLLFKRIKERYPKPAVLLSSAAGIFFGGGARRHFAGFALDPSARDFWEQVGTFDSIVVLNTTVNLVAKTASLIADTPVTGCIFRKLHEGRPVVILEDGLEHWYFHEAIKRRILSYLDTIRSYGMAVMKAEEFFSASSAASGLDRCRVCDGGECEGCGQCVVKAPSRVRALVDEGAGRIGASPGISAESFDRSIAAMIDHTLLKPDATDDDIRRLCDEARRYGFASVCVNPSKVALASRLLAGSPVKVCTVVGFPLGATTARVKAAETREAVENGADEIDMVINIGALKSGDYDTVKKDIEAVVKAAGGRTVKVILETALLTDEEKKAACRLAKEAGAHFVKTSTGFGPGGATLHDVALMRSVVGPEMGVKASGGVRDLETARKMVLAGATRIGASASVAIVRGAGAEGGGY